MPAKPIEKPFPRLFGAAFVGCLAALAALAWLPARAMTRTSLGGHSEHLIAYLVTTIVMGLGLKGRLSPAVQYGLLIAYAAILEAGQMYSPGRHASLQDLAFSSAGVVLGGVLLWMWGMRDRVAAAR